MGTGDSGSPDKDDTILHLDRPLRVLTSRQIQQIDETLARLGPFAEVRLIKNRGKLHFIQRVDSESAVGPDWD